MTTIRPYEDNDDLWQAARRDRRPRARVRRQLSPLVVLGRGSDQRQELQLDAIRADRVPVARRSGGGCAVVLDPGNLIVSAVLPLDGVGGITTAFGTISQWLIDGLARAGLTGVKKRGVSDLVWGDRKIAGSCIFRTRGLLSYSSTILFDADPGPMARYLRHPPREPEYRRGRGHEQFVQSIRPLLGNVSIDAFADQLGRALRTPGPPADNGLWLWQRLTAATLPGPPEDRTPRPRTYPGRCEPPRARLFRERHP